MAPSTFARHFPTFAAWLRRSIQPVGAMTQVIKTLIVRLTRVRYLLRWLMLAVAVVGISLGLIERRSRALALAEHHHSGIAEPAGRVAGVRVQVFMDGERRNLYCRATQE